MKRNAYRFLAAGIGTFVIDYGLTLLLHYQIGVEGALASGIGFTAGFIFSFSVNKSWTFKPKTTHRFSTRKQVGFYIVLALANLLISTFLVGLFELTGLAVWIGKGVTIILIASWNFVISHFFVFSEVKKS